MDVEAVKEKVRLEVVGSTEEEGGGGGKEGGGGGGRGGKESAALLRRRITQRNDILEVWKDAVRKKFNKDEGKGGES